MTDFTIKDDKHTGDFTVVQDAPFDPISMFVMLTGPHILADRLAAHKLNSCTCGSLRGIGEHDANCLAGAIDDACEYLRSATP